MKSNFISSKYRDEKLLMHSKCDNREIMFGNETIEIIKEFFQLFLTRYQIRLEISMDGKDFFFDSADGMYYQCNKIILNQGGWYIDSPDWIKS